MDINSMINTCKVPLQSDCSRDWNAPVGKDAQVDWGDICGPCCSDETDEKRFRLLVMLYCWPSQSGSFVLIHS